MASVPTRRTNILSVIDDVDLPEAEMLNQLRSIIKEDPDSVFAREEENGQIPLHLAAQYISPDVSKMLIEADTSLQTVRATTYDEYLPFHTAVFFGNLETAKYLYEVYPEGINTPNGVGSYPLHLVLNSEATGSAKQLEATEEIVQFLLKHDQGAMSTADIFGMLPLHRACRHEFTLLIVKHLFDAYPGAIYIRDNEGRTPLELARVNNLCPETVSFFEHQLHSIEHMSLHEALRDSGVSLGSIKLMIEMSPQSLREADRQGQLPVHIACSISNSSVAKCLVEAYPHSLQICDANNNLPLHIACREGKFGAINYILEMSDHGVGMKGGEGMLPINLLLLSADCDRNSMEYVDSVGRLLRLNPTSLISNMML